MLLQRWKVARQAGDEELEELLGLGQVLERVGTELAEAIPLAVAVVQAFSGLARHHDLTAVGGCRDPRSSMNVDAHIAFADLHRLTAVKPHPDAELDIAGPAMRVEGGLGVGCGGDRALSLLEDDEEAVALGVDLATAMGLERRPQYPPVVGKQHRIVIAKLVQQPGAALDVGEQQRHRSG